MQDVARAVLLNPEQAQKAGVQTPFPGIMIQRTSHNPYGEIVELRFLLKRHGKPKHDFESLTLCPRVFLRFPCFLPITQTQAASFFDGAFNFARRSLRVHEESQLG